MCIVDKTRMERAKQSFGAKGIIGDAVCVDSVVVEDIIFLF